MSTRALGLFALCLATSAPLLAAACGGNDETLFGHDPGTAAAGGAGGSGGSGAQGGEVGSGGSSVAATGGIPATGGVPSTGGSGGGTAGTGASGGIGASGGTGGSSGSGGSISAAGADGGPDASMICDPGTPICDGNVATVCEADGSGPSAGGTDCASQSATCTDGTCVPSCPPGALGCSCQAGAACGVGLICGSGNVCDVITPVAHWRFEDDATDSSGNGYDGNEQNNVNYTNGVDGRAASFSRFYQSYVEIDSFAQEFATIITGFTLFLRVRLDSYSTDQVHVLFGMGAPGETQDTNEFRFVFENGVVIETETGAGVNHLTTLGPLPPLDTWVEIVFVVDGDTARYYLDGALIGEQTFTLSDTTSTEMVIGGWQDDHTIAGAIDDVKVFDAPLSAEQVATLWTLSGGGG